MNAYWQYTLQEVRLILRAPSALFFNYAIPLLAFLLFAQMFHAQGEAVGRVLAMSILIGTLGNGLFGAGLRLTQDRDQHILRRLQARPVGPLVPLFGSLAGGALFFIPSAALLVVVGMVFYGMPAPPHPVFLTLVVCGGLLTFRSIGLAIASVVNSTQESLILVQGSYFPLLLLSGATIPLGFMPVWLQNGARLVPSWHLFFALLQSLSSQAIPETIWLSLSGMVATAFVCLFLGAILFRWDAEDRVRAGAKAWLACVFVPVALLGVALWHGDSGLGAIPASQGMIQVHK